MILPAQHIDAGQTHLLRITHSHETLPATAPTSRKRNTRTLGWWPLEVLLAAIAACIAILSSNAVQRLCLAAFLLNVPLGASKHFFRVEGAAEFGAVGGLQISIGTVALSVLYLGWLVRHRAPLTPVSWRSCGIPAAAFLSLEALSLFNAPDPVVGMFQVWIYLQALLTYLFISRCLRTPEEITFAVRCLMAGLLFESALMLAQAVGVIGTLKSWEITAAPADGRLSGTLWSPNSAASYLAMSIAIALGLSLLGRRYSDGRVALLCAAAALVPLLRTGSRGGIVCVFVATGLVLVRCGPLARRRLLGVIALSIVLCIPFSGAVFNRFFGDDEGSAASRTPLNEIAVRMILDSPLTGVGSNNFSMVMHRYSSSSDDWLYTVHNTYLLIASEAGLGAVVALVWFCGAAITMGWRRSGSGSPLLRSVALGCSAAIAGHMTHMLVDLFRDGAAVQLTWTCAALISAIDRQLSIRITPESGVAH